MVTPAIWAWVIQSTRRAMAARDRGEVDSAAIDQLLARGRALKPLLPPFAPGELQAALSQPQRAPGSESVRATTERAAGTPFPDDSWEAVTDAIAERAWLDPPDFSAGPVRSRESVILRLDGFPAVAVSPEEVEALDRVLASARREREVRRRREAEKAGRPRARRSQRQLGLGMTDRQESNAGINLSLDGAAPARVRDGG